MYTLIWYTFYDLRSGNGVGPILRAPQSTQGNDNIATSKHLYAQRMSLNSAVFNQWTADSFCMYKNNTRTQLM